MTVRMPPADGRPYTFDVWVSTTGYIFRDEVGPDDHGFRAMAVHADRARGSYGVRVGKVWVYEDGRRESEADDVVKAAGASYEHRVSLSTHPVDDDIVELRMFRKALVSVLRSIGAPCDDGFISSIEWRPA